jgi:hypothetical protein
MRDKKIRGNILQTRKLLRENGVLPTHGAEKQGQARSKKQTGCRMRHPLLEGNIAYRNIIQYSKDVYCKQQNNNRRFICFLQWINCCYVVHHSPFSSVFIISSPCR